MSHFLIFLPTAQGQTPKLLENVGLGDLAAGAEFMESQGPEGVRGVLIGWRKPDDRDKRLICAPKEQTWLPAVPCGDLAAKRYWVGIWKDLPPLPADLARSRKAPEYPGSSLRLGDAQEWVIPNCRELPRDAVLMATGKWELEVQERFRPLRDECLRWLDLVAGAAAGDDGKAKTVVSYSETVEFLLKGLRLNYRIVPELVSALKLFNEDTLRDALYAIIGATKYLADAA